MKWVLWVFAAIFLISCWKPYGTGNRQPSQQKVWGSKPIYADISAAKQILYDPVKHPIFSPGNIYAFGHFIFEVEIGRGIHVIDNTVPSKADRIGFITVNGCSQISIQGNYLYTNSYADLVTIDISDPVNMKELSRVPNAFPELQYDYPLSQPEDSGYYTCPIYDSVVVKWVKDSIYMNCYKN